MMFRDCFGRRAPQQDRFFRPRLEYLEDRLAPSSLGPMDDGGGNGHGHGNGHGNGHGDGGGPPGPPAQNGGISSGVNAHGSFNGSTITNSFNNTINNTYILMPAQQAYVQGFMGIGSLLASDLNSPQLGSLIDDEVALAVDTYLTSFPAVSSALPSLSGDIASLHAAINGNALANTPIGQTIGTLTFNATLNAMVSAQATI